MLKSRNRYWMVSVSLVLICVGLVLAASSNPRRFSLSPSADRIIDLLMITGLACTASGIGLLLLAIRGTTRAMIPEKRSQANLGVGIGFALQLVGLFLLGTDFAHMVGLPLILASVPLLLWGCVRYAEGKRYAKWVGLLGLAGIPGLIILIVLPVAGE